MSNISVDDRFVFVTLFDRNYLDKGLVLFDSLCRCAKEFRLYVIAFDDVTFRVLSALNDRRLIAVSLTELETEELIKVKGKRTTAEYCWTCSAFSIRHILEYYCESICTYIDADMYFYSSPSILFDEFDRSGCDAGIIRHGFLAEKEGDRLKELSGEYCVEFNTFRANENGKKILDWWCAKCLDECSADRNGLVFGDQKYLDEFQLLFHGVHVFQNLGAGVAPWNLAKFKLKEVDNDGIKIFDKTTATVVSLVFFHFQKLIHLSDNMADANLSSYPGSEDKRLVKLIYETYLKEVLLKRRYLEKSEEISFKDLSKKQRRKNILTEIIVLYRESGNIVLFLRRIIRKFLYKRRDFIRLNGT